MDTEKVQRLDGFGYLRREFRVTNSVEPPGKCLRYSLIIVAKQCMCSCWDKNCPEKYFLKENASTMLANEVCARTTFGDLIYVAYVHVRHN